MTAADFLKNETWVHRIKEVYELTDFNKDGHISVEDWELWVDNIEREVKPDAKLVEALRVRMREFCAAMGLTPGRKANKEEFLKGLAEMAARERAKRLRGEETLLERMNNAWYDAVDTNHDGFVTLDEWRTILKACNLNPSCADETFKLIDKNKNGKIERKELTDHEFKFWFTLDDQDSKGMFGDKYELK